MTRCTFTDLHERIHLRVTICLEGTARGLMLASHQIVNGARSFHSWRASTTFFAVVDRSGISQRNNNVAAIPPANCAAMNKGASTGRMPAKVSLRVLAIVTAGFANDVDAVNQYAAVM